MPSYLRRNRARKAERLQTGVEPMRTVQVTAPMGKAKLAVIALLATFLLAAAAVCLFELAQLYQFAVKSE